MHIASEEQKPDFTYNFSLCNNHFRPLTRKVLLSNGLSEEYFDQMMALLICLNENGSLILKELVIETGLPYPTLSNLIDRGEAIGVIEKVLRMDGPEKSSSPRTAKTKLCQEYSKLERKQIKF